jgi:hypothetical protein
MNLKRAKAIGKLLILFGTPAAIILGLFSCGVYCGAQNRHGITSFEKEWLGLDVEVAPPYDKGDDDKDKDKDKDKGDEAKSKDDGNEDKDEAKDDDGDETKHDGDEAKDDGDEAKDDGDEAKDDGDEAKDDGNEDAGTSPTPVDTGTTPTPTPTPVPTIVPPPEPKTDPLEGPLAQRLATPVTVRVKVLVDQELMDQQPAWIDYVQRAVSQASNIYEKQFGIELELAGVMQWSVATAGMSADELLDDVRSRPREGADILLGFTARPLDDTSAGIADTPAENSPFNGAYGVVYAMPGHRNAHVRTLLHEVAHLFGAGDITDPANADWVAGSWMSYAPVPETQAPWIDAANRARVLERKDKPFSPEPKEKGR